MLARLVLCVTASVLLIFVPRGLSQVQSAAPGQPEKSTSPSGISRSDGVDTASGIQWVRLILEGRTAAGPPGTSGPPLLIAQCTLSPDGKYKFEMLASFGDASDVAFYPPWKASPSSGPFPPALQKTSLTMQFLGYTHVKPLRRQFETPLETPGLFRYSPPGRTSSNLEEIAYDLRYLVALPTLRLSLADRTAEFQTAPLLTGIRNEPRCRAAGL